MAQMEIRSALGELVARIRPSAFACHYATGESMVAAHQYSYHDISLIALKSKLGACNNGLVVITVLKVEPR